jgi:hypothetical protein
MSYETRAYDNEHGDPVVVLVATGTHDVSRLVHLLCGASPNCEQVGVGAVVKSQVKRHNGGRAALRLLAMHGGPNFLDDDHPGLDRYCDWPGCWTYTHAVKGPWTGWLKSRRTLLCPEHSTTEHWADYTTDLQGNVNGAACRCGHSWPEAPIPLGVLNAWWQQHVAMLTKSEPVQVPR